MLSDIEIAQNTQLDDIVDVANELGINYDDLTLYGKYKAKVKLQPDMKRKGKLILVTAINPTPAGEGKTTTSIGLADSMKALGKNVVLALREPSLGPVFGVKGGATGGGYAQVAPMEDINLHFTGDFHAIENANNLLAAMLDNHIYHGNELNIDPETITLRRCMDMNDRHLRKITDGFQDKKSVERTDGFDITVASEVMAIFCLAKDLNDLKRRLGKIIVGKSIDGKYITAHDLHAEGAMTALLKDAFEPNLVQTLEHTPAFIHGGPFANIAHGCNSVAATDLALKYADYVVTEAGFGADLGAEKFLDIKCRLNDLAPSAIVLVVTTRALKYNGGVDKEHLKEHNFKALFDGAGNLGRHLHNLKKHNVPIIVAINIFENEYEDELDYLFKCCKKAEVHCVLSNVFAKGSRGGIDLARAVIDNLEESPKLEFNYQLNDSIECKISKLAHNVYGAFDVAYTEEAKNKIVELTKEGYGDLPICIAKTQYSFSDDPKLLGAPSEFVFNVREVKLSAGAEFIVVICGDIMTMPGLPKVPAAEKIDVVNGKIVGLF